MCQIYIYIYSEHFLCNYPDIPDNDCNINTLVYNILNSQRKHLLSGRSVDPELSVGPALRILAWLSTINCVEQCVCIYSSRGSNSSLI